MKKEIMKIKKNHLTTFPKGWPESFIKVEIKRIWFTLIELLVVISIIMIISTSWVFYFFNFIWSQKIKQEIEIIKDELRDIDKDIKTYKIFDYNLIFDTLSWSLAYTYYINFFDNSNSQIINFDSYTWKWIITISWWSPDLWNLKIYKNIKLSINEIISWNVSYTWSFLDKSDYKISGYLSWITLNDIKIRYFSETNLDKWKWDFLELMEINTLLDKTWSWYTNLKITNIWNKKEILWNWIDKLDKAYLFFEREGREENLLIEK